MVAVVQLVERQFVVLDVAGSSPVGHPNRTVGGTQVPLHCSGPGFSLGDAPLAQRQSNGLLIRRFWVRNPGGAPKITQVPASRAGVQAHTWSQLDHIQRPTVRENGE